MKKSLIVATLAVLLSVNVLTPMTYALEDIWEWNRILENGTDDILIWGKEEAPTWSGTEDFYENDESSKNPQSSTSSNPAPLDNGAQSWENLDSSVLPQNDDNMSSWTEWRNLGDTQDSSAEPQNDGSDNQDESKVSYPAIEDQKSFDSTLVSVVAPEWAFPEGTKLSISPVLNKDLKQVEKRLEWEISENTKVVAFDITFSDPETGDEIQPNEWYSVQVSFDFSENKDINPVQWDTESIQVFHLNNKDQEWNLVDEITVEPVDIVENSDWVLTIDAESFSVYTIVYQHETVTPQRQNFTWEDITICNPDDETSCITIMDRNLWATSDSIEHYGDWTYGNSYGYHYQWWNNYGFDPADFKDDGKIYQCIEQEDCGMIEDEDGEMVIDPECDVCLSWDNDFNYNWFYLNEIVDNTYNIAFGRGRDDYSNLRKHSQWPCPDGYHVPNASEWNNLLVYWAKKKGISVSEGKSFFNSDTSTRDTSYSIQEDKNALTQFRTYFKLPFAWYNEDENKNWYYWMSDSYLNIFQIRMDGYAWISGIAEDYDADESYWLSVRCFKDMPDSSDDMYFVKVKFETNGGSEIDSWDIYKGYEIWYQLGFYKEGDEYIYSALWTNRNNSLFVGWYTDKELTQKLDPEMVVTENLTLYAKWECDEGYAETEDGQSCKPERMVNQKKNQIVKDLMLLLVTNDWSSKVFTIMDRNMWATLTWAWANASTWSYGYHYQRWNNYWFESCYENGCTEFPWWENTSSAVVERAEWIDLRYSNFASNIFRTVENWIWWTSATDYANKARDMWWAGWDSNTQNKTDRTKQQRQWPCPDGYYVSTAYDWVKLQEAWKNSVENSLDYTQFAADLLLPFAWYRTWSDKKITSQWTRWLYWTSTWSSNNNSYRADVDPNNSTPIRLWNDRRSFAQSIRCFKNDFNIDWKSSFELESNGWVWAVVTVDDGIIITLWEPTKEWVDFVGWYTTPKFVSSTKVSVWSDISNAKWLYAMYSDDSEWMFYTYKANGWVFEDDADTYNESYTIWTDYEDADNPLWVSRVWYVFDGWYTKAEWWEKASSHKVSDAKTFYAQWILADKATLVSGAKFNETIKKLANGKAMSTEDSDIKITAIKKADSIPSGVTTQLISTSGSVPVYAWFDDGTIYYYSESETIYMNADSSFMFKNLESLNNIEVLEEWKADNVTSLYDLFNGCKSLSDASPVYNWNTKNVKDFNSTFYGCESLTDLDLSNWNTSSATQMRNMFQWCTNLSNIRWLDQRDTSNVTSMRYMFAQSPSLTELNLSSWDTSKVKEMRFMFYQASSLETVYVWSWFVTDSLDEKCSTYDDCWWVEGTGGINMFKDTKLNLPNADAWWANTWDTWNLTNIDTEEEGKKIIYYIFDANWGLFANLREVKSIPYKRGSGVSVFKENENNPTGYEYTFIPEREHYVFVWWFSEREEWVQMEQNEIAEVNKTYYAHWEPRKYTIKFVDEDGTTVLKEATEYEYGTASGDIVKPADPTKASDKNYTYTFDKWEPEIVPVIWDATYTAVYTAKKKWSKWSGGWKWWDSDPEPTHGSADDERPDEDISQPEDNEEDDVHAWAYKNGLTRYANMKDARFDDPLNRAEMAKISSIFDTNFLGRTPDESKESECSSYPDIQKMKWDLHYFVVQSCELKNMWYHYDNERYIPKFMPYKGVSVAEASVILSRMAWWKKYIIGPEKWYQWHMYAVYEHVLIDDTSDPWRHITRREAFTALYRLDKLLKEKK